MLKLDLSNIPGALHIAAMEKSFIGERCFPSRRPVMGMVLRFSATGAGNAQSCLGGRGPAPSSPGAQRSGECSPGGGQGLRLAGLASGPNLLAGAACLASWGFLWLLTVSDFVSFPGSRSVPPGGNENADAATLFHQEELIAPIDYKNIDRQVIHDSLPHRPAGPCGSAMIELNDSCILGEEIEVSSPPGWRRPRAHVETD